MMNVFFKSQSDRNLWIKLKAEFIQEFQKRVNKKIVCIGSINEPYTPMRIAKNQLEFDEKCGVLRISLEELLTFTYEQYENRLRCDHKEWFNKIMSA